MFGISYNSWKKICNMFFTLSKGTQKSYLQWFPFSILTDNDKIELLSESFFEKYIKTGGFVFFPEVMRHSENYIQKTDGSFRNSKLISPLLFLILQAVGYEISTKYCSRRPNDISVFYAGNFETDRAKYKKDYDNFYKAINAESEKYDFFIKTDITNFFGNINVNELIARINTISNSSEQIISQTQLLLIKELLLFCGDGYYPLIENSLATSYLATVVYLDEIDCELYNFILTKVKDISEFKMVRYVDDLYILFSSSCSDEKNTQIYNTIKNGYSSLLKKHGLALNTKKCTLKPSINLNEELKKSLYDEYVNHNEHELGELFQGKLKDFLQDIYDLICTKGITNEDYSQLIEKHFRTNDIEMTATDVYNYFVYENQTQLSEPEITRLLLKIIKRNILFLSIDPKRLSVMIMQSGKDTAIKAMLNQLFIRARDGVWNSYDTTIAITYLIQSKFQHIDLLDIICNTCPNLFAYYFYSCKSSFLCQTRNEKWNRYLRCLSGDSKAAFLYFMNICELNRFNYLSSYAYFKNFFDRISADMAYLTGFDKRAKKPHYNNFYQERNLKNLYNNIPDSDQIIEKAHKFRNENPLSHASAGLIDKDSSSQDLQMISADLDSLIDQYSRANNL